MKAFIRNSATFLLALLIPTLISLPSSANTDSKFDKFEIFGAAVGDTYASGINKILSNGGKLNTIRAEISQTGWFYATYLEFETGSNGLGREEVKILTTISWENYQTSRINYIKSFYRWSQYDGKPFNNTYFPEYITSNPIVFITRDHMSPPNVAPLPNTFKSAVISKYGPYLSGGFEYKDALLWPYSKITQKEQASLCISAFSYPEGATDDWGINNFFEAYKACQKIGWMVVNFGDKDVGIYSMGVFDYETALKHMVEFNNKRESAMNSEKAKKDQMRETPKF